MRKRLKRRLRLMAIAIGVAVLVAAVAVWWAIMPLTERPHAVRFTINAGSNPVSVARNLQRRHLIRSSATFLVVAAVRGSLWKMRPGLYKLDSSWNLVKLADRLGAGGEARVRVTIPEGFTVHQIAQRLQARGIVTSASDFVALAQSSHPPVSTPFPTPSSGLEGYLFPETYELLPNSAPAESLQTMVDAFSRRFFNPNAQEIARRGRTLNQLVTMASLIEREAELDTDRPKIAGVIENRLKANMRLQIDASVIYALGHHVPRVTYAELKVKSPYNTYLHSGLPPGPIASPGLPSLLAALHPQQSNFLFYVQGPGGAHIFTHSLAEHYRAVARMKAARAAASRVGATL